MENRRQTDKDDFHDNGLHCQPVSVKVKYKPNGGKLMTGQEHQIFLQPTATIECDHEQIRRYVTLHAPEGLDARNQAVRLYYAVRDGIRYDPYAITLDVEGLKATTTLHAGRGWCVAKAILLAACCRAAGIPARLGFADVRNHLSTERLRRHMNTDIFYWHGYTAIYLDGAWIKATPAFNVELCQRFRLKPLEFDGRKDSIYHPFDLDGRQHMEYIAYRGEFADVPIESIVDTFTQAYGPDSKLADHDFDADVDHETRG